MATGEKRVEDHGLHENACTLKFEPRLSREGRGKDVRRDLTKMALIILEKSVKNLLIWHRSRKLTRSWNEVIHHH